MSRTINTYQKFWKYESKVYKVGNIRLWFPVNPYDIAYFMGAFFAMLFLKNIWIINKFDVTTKFIIIPVIITLILRYIKYEGKPPFVFLKDFIVYILYKQEKYQFFEPIRKEMGASKIEVKWKIGCRARGGY